METKFRAPLLGPRSAEQEAGVVCRPVGISGIGSYVPDRVLTNAELETMVETSDEWIRTRTGIIERRLAAPEQKTSDLALIAAERALANARLPASEVDLIIVATVTPDYPFPAVASLVQAAVGATRAAAFDLAAGCSGFIYAMTTGAQFIRSGAYRSVLIVGAETISRLVDWTDRSTCVLFGDGAGAVVLQPCEPDFGVLSFDLGSDGTGASLLIVDEAVPTAQCPPYIVQGRHAIKMQGSEVFKFAVRVIEESTRRALAAADLTVDDIDCFVAHQANARIFDAAAKRMGIPAERVYNNVHKYGNTSAASIPLALDEARAEGRVNPGDILALVGFGAGLSWASAIVRWQ